jgi:hypothetical protein
MNQQQCHDRNHASANLLEHLELVLQRDLALMRLEEMVE